MNSRTFRAVAVLFLVDVVCGVAAGAAKPAPAAKGKHQGAPTQAAASKGVAAKENAATYYREAFALAGVQPEAEGWLLAEAEVKPPDDPAVVEVLAKYERAFVPFHKAAALKHCDWGLKPGPDGQVARPHLLQVNRLRELVFFRSRLAFHQRRYVDGFTDAADLLALARHIVAEPSMLSRLFGDSLAVSAAQSAADRVTGAPPEALKQFAARLDALPPRPPAARVIQVERDAVMNRLRKLEAGDPAAPFNPGGEFDKYAQAMRLDPTARPRVEQLRAVWVDPAQRNAAIAEVAAMFDEATQHFAAPPAEARPRLEELEQRRAASANPLLGMVVPMFDHFFTSVYRDVVTTAMLRAAVAYRLEGAAGLKKFPDPFGKGLFELRPHPGGAPGGFEVASAMIAHKRPVMLAVAPPPKGAAAPPAPAGQADEPVEAGLD